MHLPKVLLSEDRPGTLKFGGARMALLDIEAGFWGLRRQMEGLVGPRLTGAVLQYAGASSGASFARKFLGQSSEIDGAQALCDILAAYQAAGLGQFQVEALEWPIGRALVRGTDSIEAWMMRQHGWCAETPVCAYAAGVLVGFANVLGGRRDIVCVERTCQAHGDGSCLFELLPAEVAGDVPAVGLTPDPAVGQELNLLEILFDRMPMGIAIFDQKFRFRRCNLTYAGYLDRYTPFSVSQVVSGVSWFDLAPGSEDLMIPIFERVLAGEVVRDDPLRLEVAGIVSYWDEVFTPLIENGNVVGIIEVTTDATERVEAQEKLREREEQYRGIFESTTDALLIFDFAGTVVEANPAACGMYGYSYKDLIGLSVTDVVHPDSRHLFEDFKRKVAAGERFHAQAVNLRKDGTSVNVEVHGASFGYRGQPHILAVVRDVTERVLAYQTLEEQVVKRTRELQTLLDVTAAASSSLALDEMLSASLDRLVQLVGASRAGVFLRDQSPAELRLQMVRPPRVVEQHDLARLTRLSQEVIAGGESVYSGDPEPVVLLPLRSRGQALGVLSIVGVGGSEFSHQQIALFEAIADQLGVAIENARLYEQAEQAAVLEERQRLARELHDSVAQSLYSVTFFAEAGLRVGSAGDSEGAHDCLRRVSQTAQEVLREMRLLVYELRPHALEREGLLGALEQRLDAVERRAGVDVSLQVDGMVELPPAVAEGLYRIAQEALNNALKHAGSTAVTVRVSTRGDRVELEIVDNGRGFSTSTVSDRGGIGLASMRERAERLGGSLRIISAPGQGTSVKASLEAPRNCRSLV